MLRCPNRVCLMFGALLVLVLAQGCDLFSASPDPCVPRISIEPDPGGDTLTLQTNQTTRLTATVEIGDECGAPPSWEVSWTWDENADGVLSDAELAAKVVANQFQLFACVSDIGSHLLRIEANPVTDTEREKLVRDLTVRITGKETTPARPACYADALATIRNTQAVSAATVGPLQEALGCIEPYLLNDNICDVEASYAAGLARFGVFNAKTPTWFRERNSMSVQDVIDIFNDEVIPMLDRFELVRTEADESFRFFVDGQFNVLAFEDQPDLEGDQAQFIVLQGEHDYTDVWAISAINAATRGFFEMIQAYDGLIRWMLDYPPLGEVQEFADFRHLFLNEVIDNPEFLTLADDAQPHLRRAQLAFMDFFGYLEQAVDLVRRETDSQGDDLFRYWDCGSDGVCDCNAVDEQGLRMNSFLACPNDQSLYKGPDDDGTEGNGRYDVGELIGTDRLGNSTQFSTVDLPSNADEFTQQMRLLRDNVQGPDPLDLDALVGNVPGGTLSVVLSTLVGMPVPEIRLSEWFVTPSAPRNLVPLFSISERDFLFDIESEPYEDAGYDGKYNPQESIVHVTNPRELAVGTPRDKLTNPDPSFDDLDPFCNPICNANDGIDNDGDGMTDAEDLWVFGGGFDFNADLGVENNLTFDWIDLDQDLTHDPGEPSETFEDSGVVDFRGQTINRAGAWDFADRAHTFPSGDDVGPISTIDQVDPPNGTNGYTRTDADGRPVVIPPDDEIRGSLATIPPGSQADYEGLYDSFYFFFPDPTFSGVLEFPEPAVSLTGELMTANAKLMRFFSKILELAALVTEVGSSKGVRQGDQRVVPARESFGHVCSSEAACAASLCIWQPGHSICP